MQSNNLASGWIGDISTTRSGLGVLLCPKSDDDDDSASDASSNILLSSQVLFMCFFCIFLLIITYIYQRTA